MTAGAVGKGPRDRAYQVPGGAGPTAGPGRGEPGNCPGRADRAMGPVQGEQPSGTSGVVMGASGVSAGASSPVAQRTSKLSSTRQHAKTITVSAASRAARPAFGIRAA